MKRPNHINKAIEYLQSIKEQEGVIVEITIYYGIRDATPSDKGYCKWANTKTPDGTFLMNINGFVPKEK
tara:strand:- start:965 stop:1171 length:207 start_codon:yes stop_codon:yes gene_type:complete